jgi:hypothetical protein
MLVNISHTEDSTKKDPKGSGDSGMGESVAVSRSLPNEGGMGGGYMDGAKSCL